MKIATYNVNSIRIRLDVIIAWLEKHEYESVAQMQGSMSEKNVPNPKAFQRANYMKVLSSYAVK